MNIMDNFSWSDRTVFKLRGLYESYGYDQYHTSKFEPYDIYQENRSFLQNKTVISFSDPYGRLMALRPDVTMSIVKSTAPETDLRKVYYVENVFRLDKSTREYREIEQIGIEAIGNKDEYLEAEALILALKTLETISDKYILSTGHMGFVSAMLDACALNDDDNKAALDALRNKNLAKLRKISERSGLSKEWREILEETASICEPASIGITKLKQLSKTDEMDKAVLEIERSYNAINALGYGEKVRLDFAIINDMDYYNGIVLQGYIEGIPRAVLSGGRYDLLMKKFGKPQSALGFALYLGELTRFFTSHAKKGIDVLLIRGDTPIEVALITADRFIKEGLRVSVEKNMSYATDAKKILKIKENGDTEEYIKC